MTGILVLYSLQVKITTGECDRLALHFWDGMDIESIGIKRV